MSLKDAAKYLEAHGRNGDTKLVHMTDNEIKSLRAMAKAQGGDLTVNPHTGLPEANFLESLLPMAAGAALTYFSGGALAPWAAGLMVGAEETMRTGDLGKGVMSGLGAWSGGSLSAGLAAAGSESLANTAAQQTGQELTTKAAMDPNAWGSLDTTGTYQEALKNQINPQNLPNLSGTQIQGLQEATANAANPADVVRSASMANAASTPYSTQVGQGIKSLGTTEGAGNFIMNNKMPLASVASAALLDKYGQPQQPEPNAPDQYDKKMAAYRLGANYKPYVPQQPNPYYTPSYPTYAMGGPVEGLAPGGLAAAAPHTLYPQSQQEHTNFATATQMPTSAQVVASDYDARTNPYTGEEVVGMAAGGDVKKAKKPQYTTATKIASIQATQGPFEAARAELDNMRYQAKMPTGVAAAPRMSVDNLGDYSYAKGGIPHLLKGPGDGMSDDIPATIQGKQPARLADGEFVVPADVVSHIGNGSTDAGAKKLYTMMDNIRKARTGTKKQGKEIKAEKYFPKA